METIISKNKKLLLHVCCGTCAAYVSQLLQEEYQLVLYYQNSNIFPKEEFKKRKADAKKIASKWNVDFIFDDYEHEEWREYIKGFENEPEKGKRCFKCYEYRMKKLAKKAKKLNFSYFATTLSVSPHKVYEYIKKIGQDLEKNYNLKYYDKDFKKKDGFKKANKISRELNLYRQDYCGCEFIRNNNQDLK